MTQPSGGWAPEDVEVPSEFNPGPGYMAEQRGVPPKVASDPRYTARQANYPGRDDVTASQKLRAAYTTDPVDPQADADPLSVWP